MPSPDTVTLLTPPGSAAIAVVRLAGPGVGAFLGRHFARPTPEGRCVHGELRDERGEVLDDPVVVCSASGQVADLSLHGGPWVVQSVKSLAERAGFRRIDPALGCDAGADDALEREVLAHLPFARTELGLRTLLAQPRAWARLKAGATAHIGLQPEELRRVLDDPSLRHLLEPPRVAIVGAPNVGKSTLANQLFGEDRSVTADLAGTTRDWVGEVANLDGLAVMLVDTPGVRETPDALERAAIQRSRGEVARADLVVLVLDATQPLAPEQEPLLRALPDAVIVINKSDRQPAWPAERVGGIQTVATIGAGVDLLRKTILGRFQCLDLVADRPRIWTPRQRAIVERALADPGALAEV